MCCHDDLIESNFGTLDGFKSHFATEWGCTVEELTYEEIDLTPLEIKKLIDAEWKKANDYALSLVDRNMREKCLNIKGDVALGKFPSEHPILDIISQYDSAVSGVWPQYYENKGKIKNGESPIEYTSPQIPTEEEFNSILYGTP